MSLSASFLIISISHLYFKFQKQPMSSELSTSSTLMQSDRNIFDTDGKIIFRKDTYVIVTASFNNLEYAKKEVARLRSMGETSGYFWRPDFPSLEGRPMYSTFIGFYDSYEDCSNRLRQLRIANQNCYGLKLTKGMEKVRIF